MDTSEINSKTRNILQNLKLQQVVGEIEFPKIFAFIPWGHHIQKVQNPRFYQGFLDFKSSERGIRTLDTTGMNRVL